MAQAEIKQNPSLIESMFETGAHFGYSRSKRHPSFKNFIFGSKEKIDIIDLEKTGSHLSTALEFVREAAGKGKNILFVGTKPEAYKAINELVVPLGVLYVTHHWVGGTLTNLSEIRKRVARFEELQEKKEKGELDVYTKKERLLLDREMEDLLKKFGGIIAMKQPPDILFVVDPKYEDTACAEARRKKIPVIALSGTDCDISGIDYPIPANDSSLSSIRFFVGKIIEAYQEGVKDKEQKEAEKELSREGSGEKKEENQISGNT